jgi:peptidoglycan/xylan/chitin deacetylase (PgdA/CDA1 family)
MIRVRDDDVILASLRDLESFKRVHEMILKYPHARHVAALLVNFATSEWDNAGLEYVRQEHQAGRLELQLHGYDHVDYGAMSHEATRTHLQLSEDWFVKKFGVRPTIWYTPWGANTEEMQRLAKLFKLQVVDCSDINQTHKILPALRGRNRIDYIKHYKEHGEVMIHYWESRSTKALDEVLESLS